MDAMKHDAEHQTRRMTRIIEFTSKINASFSTIKQRKLNSIAYSFSGWHPGWSIWCQGCDTLDTTLALPLPPSRRSRAGSVHKGQGSVVPCLFISSVSRHASLPSESQHSACLLRALLGHKDADGTKRSPGVPFDMLSQSAGLCSLAEYKTGNPFNYLWSRRLSVGGWQGRTVFQGGSSTLQDPPVLLALPHFLFSQPLLPSSSDFSLWR